MRKNGFTLVEILVSVVLLGLISLFVASTIFQTKKNSKIFEKKIEKRQKIESLTSTLYEDLLQSYELNITNYKNYSIISFRSKNSIYAIDNPYILWLVLKKDNTLARLESSKLIQLPIREEEKRYIFMDTMKKACQFFQVKLSKDKKSLLVYIEIKNHSPILFEVKKI